MAINNKIYTQSLEILLNWFYEYQDAKNLADQNKRVHISSDDLKKLNDLKAILDKLFVLESVQLIKHYATEQYGEIDKYVIERLTTLRNALRNTELELNNVMARNNNQVTSYSERLKKQIDKIRNDISMMEGLKNNPSALISYILDKYKYVIAGGVDNLIRDMISSDAYLQTHETYFVEDEKEGLTINEANILLALEVLEGKTDHYEYLRVARDCKKDATKIVNADCSVRVSNFIKLLNEYNTQLKKMNYAHSQRDILFKKFEHNYFHNTNKRRAQDSLNNFNMQYQQAMRLLASLLVRIKSEFQYFLSIGCEFTDVNSIKQCLSIEDPAQYQKMPIIIDNLLHRKLISKIWEKREKDLNSLNEKEERANSQIPEDLKDANPDSVMHMVNNSNITYDWETTQIALTTLLIINGFKNNVIYNSLTTPNDKRVIMDRIRNSSQEFLNKQREADGMSI